MNDTYKDVVSVSKGMTILLCLCGGNEDKLLDPFFIFQNGSEHYPIREVPDNITGSSYRTRRNGCMDKRVFVEWLGERRVIPASVQGVTRNLFCDSAACHRETIPVKMRWKS